VAEVLDFPSLAGRHVLEIGHGMGCDLATAARHGAIVHGIDLTPQHHEMTKAMFQANGWRCDLKLGNAGELPWPDASMDFVYSLGVLHHTDNAPQCIAEVHRVLKPGGSFVISLYHFWSLPHLWLVLVNGVLRGQLFQLGYRGLLSTIEAGADGITIKPLVKLYSDRSIRTLLASFDRVEVSIHGLAYKRISAVGPWLPSSLGRWAERKWGWYVVGRAIK
jgi:ubiquinone/menaquinone biosynthesis C-methylase UbiE